MSSAIARSHSLVRLLCCLLSYALLLTLTPPPALTAAGVGTAAPGAGKAAKAVTAAKRQADAPRREGELLVRFGQDVTEHGKEAVVSSKGARRKGRLRGESRLEKLELPAGQDPAAVAEQLRSEPGVELAEPNFVVTRSEVTADDPRFGEQWALRNTGQSGGVPGSDIGASNAWTTTSGSQTAVVAVIDSGVDFTHPDLRDNQWVNAREKENGRDDDRDGFADDLNGWDWVAGSGRVVDENGHGTSVAGIIAAQGNNGVGVSGVMWRASLMSLRVLDAGGTGDVAAAVEAIDYAAAHGAQVVNCSWGTDAESLALRDAISRADRRGVVVVASAGNGSRDLDSQPYYPASYDLPNLISVASSDQFDNLAPFSDWGAAGVTLAAPGTDILTTKRGGDYRLVSGTSASAPLVSGAAGLVKTLRPWLTAAATKRALVDGVRPVDTLAGKVAAGGVLNAAGALDTLRGPYDPPPGAGNGRGNGSGNGQGNGPAGPTPRPPDPGRGRGNYKGTPPPATASAPPGGPDLLALRDQPSYVPSGPPPQRIAGNAPPVCEDCYEASGSSDPQFSQSRSLPSNQTGEPAVDLGSKNYNWSLPLVSLPGRAGHNLSLTLYYNSLVWVKQGNSYQFDADGGYPSPGFQLGFPRIQKPYNLGFSYMMITPSGGRVAMHQKTADTYESNDGSYTQLKLLSGGWARVTTTDGTQYTFEPTPNGEKRCREVKDRNGNLISVYYDWAGRIERVVDTLGRQVNFIYNGNGQLFQLTQDRAGSGHTDLLAQFDYSDVWMQPLFVNSAGNFVWPLGPYDTYVSLLSRVWIPDGGTYHFEYTLYGQVYQIIRRAPDGHTLGYELYNLPSSPITAHITQQECPRFTEQRVYVEYGLMQQGAELTTTFATDAAGTVTQVTYPDGTVYKEFFDSGATEGWRKGLTIGSELWSGGVPRKWTNVSWSHDGTAASSQAVNPRVTQIVVEDAEGNRRKMTVEYVQGYSLPTHVREYGKVGGQEVELRLTTTHYNLEAAYLDRRIIGLPSERAVTDSQAGRVVSKEWYFYDWGAPFFSAQAPSVQYSDPNLLVGRGNLTVVQRFNCPENGPAICQEAGSVYAARTGYNMAGSPVWAMDALGHQTSISYTDSFSDAGKNGLGTLAYPTAVTDPEGYQSTTRYDYTTGAPTEARRPTSGTAAQGTVTYETRAFIYDWTARLQKEEVQNTGFYTRYEYTADGLAVKSFQNITPNLENYSVEVYDGAGRVRRTATYMPYSNGSFSGRQFYYDTMGRLAQWTNPTEMDPNWDAYGSDAPAAGGFGWVSTSRTFDWQGRPRVTTYPDGSTTELSYGGCGCAGGDVTTARDQRGRVKKLYRDTLGRLTKVEELNYDSTVYSTAAYAYNARNQLTSIRHYQGTDQSGVFQQRTFAYDGHGRLSSRTTPEQGTTSYSYKDDDTLEVMTDARGATHTYAYTPRHLLGSITYGVPAGVAPTGNVTFDYDAAGHRTQMTDGMGTATYHYDSAGRMDWEERTLGGLGPFRLTYGYNNAGLASVTDPSQFGGAQLTYPVDHTGAPTGVNGSGPWNHSVYSHTILYRATGGVRSETYGNGRVLSVGYDKMMRVSEWAVSGVQAWKYSYSDFGENTGRVTYAQNTYESGPQQADPTLDHSYDYDQVGRLLNSYTGTEARAHAGRAGGAWGVHDGPYSQAYLKDVWGNVTRKWGRDGDPDQFIASFTNNKRDDFSYDSAGNLTWDRGQTFTYDATGQQATASYGGYSLQQSYDGDRLRVRKVENGVTTYYLRSSVLGGQVVAEMNSSGAWQRGYVYGPTGNLLAIRRVGGVPWVYQDPVTKTQRMADSAGNVMAGVDLDPWGRETQRGWNQAQFPRRYTTYERDGNQSDEAMHRRYNRWHLRFDQPDPYDGSYDLTDPQSFNRYTYTRNDPVNFTDPSGLIWWCTQADGGPMDCDYEPDPPVHDPTGPIVNDRLRGGDGRVQERITQRHSQERGPGQPNDCLNMADDAQQMADKVIASANEWNGTSARASLMRFNRSFSAKYAGASVGEGPLGIIPMAIYGQSKSYRADYGQRGFAPQFRDSQYPNDTDDQTHHFAAYFSAAVAGHSLLLNIHRSRDNQGDANLGRQAQRLGRYLRNNPSQLKNIGKLIEDTICKGNAVPR